MVHELGVKVKRKEGNVERRMKQVSSKFPRNELELIDIYLVDKR